MKKIGEVATLLNVSIDTLRYYEKIDLLNDVERNHSGTRLYSQADIAKIQFIKQAKKMNFSLDEVKQLLQFRADPSHVKPQIREMATQKLAAINANITALTELRDQMQRLIQACQTSGDSCPIIDQLNQGAKK